MWPPKIPHFHQAAIGTGAGSADLVNYSSNSYCKMKVHFRVVLFILKQSWKSPAEADSTKKPVIRQGLHGSGSAVQRAPSLSSSPGVCAVVALPWGCQHRLGFLFSFQAPNMQRTRSVPTVYFWISLSPAAGLSCDLWGRKACGVFLNYCCAAWKGPFCNCSLSLSGFEELQMQSQGLKPNLNNLSVCFSKERSTELGPAAMGALLLSHLGCAGVCGSRTLVLFLGGSRDVLAVLQS